MSAARISPASAGERAASRLTSPGVALAGVVLGEDALVDVLRAVPVGLLDLDGEGVAVGRGEGAVDPDAASRRELDDHEPGLLPGGQPVQRVAFGEAGVDRERGRRDGFEEAGRAGQRRGPQPPVGVPGGDDRERAVGQERDDTAAQLGRVKHRRQPLRLLPGARSLLHGQLAGVKADVGDDGPTRAGAVVLLIGPPPGSVI